MRIYEIIKLHASINLITLLNLLTSNIKILILNHTLIRSLEKLYHIFGQI